MDEKLGQYEGPWFLPGDAPTLVDLQYVTHLERMNASCLFWKGLKCRGSGRWPNIDRWFAAFEDRPAYLVSDMLGRAGRGRGLTLKLKKKNKNRRPSPTTTRT